MVALVATIHVFARLRAALSDIGCAARLERSRCHWRSKTWMVGTSPTMTWRRRSAYAAFLPRPALASAKAYSIQGSSALRSRDCTVAPHQMRRPGGASR